jgi:peroxiredoxin
MITIVSGTVLLWLLVAVGTWLAYQFVRQNGRILLRLEAIEHSLAARSAAPRNEPAALPVGTLAPEFALPDLRGVRRRLSDFRGRDLLLIFFNPQCGFCTAMLDDLAALSAEGDNRQPVPVIITTGHAKANRELFQQHGVRCVVLRQKQMDVAAKYGAQGTPMGYRIDSEGRIASELAAGSEALLRLAAPDTGHQHAHVKGSQHHGQQPDPSLARSRINRSGLKAGTPAPDFRLPLLEGGEVSLLDLRGRPVLLVFSDPDCGPCDELAPELEDLHRERPDLQVLVVSRRDAEASRLKARTLGLTYPIVMQQQWEISLKYGMFATPIGYLIDEQGVLLSDVAVGVGSILALADDVVPASPDPARVPSRPAAMADCSS